MKTSINFLSFVLAVAISLSLSAQENEKFYQVKDDGSYQFTYWKNLQGSKSAVHPVTIRTFFLEAQRTGVIPIEFTYFDFTEMTPPEQQAIVNNSQVDIIAAIERRNQGAFDLSENTVDLEAAQFIKKLQSDQLSQINYSDHLAGQDNLKQEGVEVIDDNDLFDGMTLPWLVMAVTHSGSETIDAINNASLGSPIAADPSKEQEMSWVVRAISDPNFGYGSSGNIQAQAGSEEVVASAQNFKSTGNEQLNNKPLYAEVTAEDGLVHRFVINAHLSDLSSRSDLNSRKAKMNHNSNRNSETVPAKDLIAGNSYNKEDGTNIEPDLGDIRARLIQLLNELIAYQGDQEFGRIFPGLDGKLYGTSDAELDEILTAMIYWTEDMMNEDEKEREEEIKDIYNELVALAMIVK